MSLHNFSALVPLPSEGVSDPNLIWTSAIVSAGIVAVLYFQSNKSDGFNHLTGFPIVGSWSFFTKRAEFLDTVIAASRAGKTSKFNILGHSIIVATGEAARKAYYSTRALAVGPGYEVLWGTAEGIDEVAQQNTQNQKYNAFFMRRLQTLLHRDRLQKNIPQLFTDLHTHMASWPQTGRIDPFTKVYNVIFHMIIRTLGVKELADDLEAVDKLARLFWDSEQESSFASAVLPWVHSRGKKNREKAIETLYGIFNDIICKRKAEGRHEDDALQYMLDQDDTLDDIIPFLLWAIFIGTVTTGIVVCWVLMFIQTHPEWEAKVSKELEELLKEYSEDSTLPKHMRFSQIPVDAWEGSTPVMEAIITETVRIVMNGPTLRRNLGDDMEINGLKVKYGEFMMYPMGVENLNPDNYPDPLTWDPARWADPSKLERDRSQGTFLGWGIGLHPCHGMRIAKLDMKITTALFLHMFEYSRVDKHGNPFTSVPEPNLSDPRRISPKGEGRYLQYTRRPESVAKPIF